LSTSIPKSKMKGVLEELEMFALQRGSQSSFDISTFNEAQKDKLLDILSINKKILLTITQKELMQQKKLKSRKLMHQ